MGWNLMLQWRFSSFQVVLAMIVEEMAKWYDRVLGIYSEHRDCQLLHGSQNVSVLNHYKIIDANGH